MSHGLTGVGVPTGRAPPARAGAIDLQAPSEEQDTSLPFPPPFITGALLTPTEVCSKTSPAHQREATRETRHSNEEAIPSQYPQGSEGLRTVLIAAFGVPQTLVSIADFFRRQLPRESCRGTALCPRLRCSPGTCSWSARLSYRGTQCWARPRRTRALPTPRRARSRAIGRRGQPTERTGSLTPSSHGRRSEGGTSPARSNTRDGRGARSRAWVTSDAGKTEWILKYRQ